MAQGIARLGDTTTGHGCWPPRPGAQAAGASAKVFANGIPVHCVGDPWPVHVCVSYPFPAHAGTVANGSGSVKVGGVAVARMGDKIDCGDVISVGSGNVFAG